MEAFTPEQERFNANTHFAGMAFGILALPVLLYVVYNAPATVFSDVLGAVTYGIVVIMVFAFSALYHFFSTPKLKDRMEIWDHVGIYCMIAGSYTPFILAYAEKSDQALMLGTVWGFALIGSVFKYFYPARFRILSMMIYVVMGVLIIIAPQSFKDALPPLQLWLIVGGALVYLVGLVFYVWAMFEHHHAVWHIFVFGGAVTHYIAVIFIFA